MSGLSAVTAFWEVARELAMTKVASPGRYTSSALTCHPPSYPHWRLTRPDKQQQRH